jgi:hypothetical protein
VKLTKPKKKEKKEKEREIEEKKRERTKKNSRERWWTSHEYTRQQIFKGRQKKKSLVQEQWAFSLSFSDVTPLALDLSVCVS